MLLLCAAASGVIGVALLAQQPVFRATEVVSRLEVTVLDSRTRKPIRGLQASDFEVKLGGKIQPITALAEVTREPGRMAPRTPFVDAASDTTSNHGVPERLFVIILDDTAGTNDPFERRMGKEIAYRIVESLQPGDLAAVVFPRASGRSQDFTADRTLLRQAIDHFRPVPGQNTRVIGRVRDFLMRVPGPRKAIFFISADGSTGRTFESEASHLGKSLGQFTSPDVSTLNSVLGSTIGSQSSHIPLYLFSTRGLVAPTAKDLLAGQLRASSNENAEHGYLALAKSTGGRAVVSNNLPSGEVPAIFEEMASYYVLAYESTFPVDGALRWLSVSIKRPGAMVMPTDVAIKTADPDTVVAARTQRDRESGLLSVMAAPFSTGDLPLTLAMGSFRLPTDKQHAAVLTLALPTRSEAFDYDLDLRLFDAEGRRQVHEARSRVSVPAGTDEVAEVLLRFDAPPGRYNIRLSATEARPEGRAGMVAGVLTVPDFGRAALSLSTVAIGHAGRRQPGGRAAIEGLLSFAPTAVRSFSQIDKVGALVTVHQGARTASRTVTMELEIVDQLSRTVVHQHIDIAPEAFQAGKGAEYRYELPLAKLAPGPYLLRLVATVAKERVQRDVQFSVRQ